MRFALRITWFSERFARRSRWLQHLIDKNLIAATKKNSIAMNMLAVSI
jgi:hypothetical protein